MDSVPLIGGKLPLMGKAELRRRFGGISGQRVDEIVKKASFPAPVADLDMGRVWLRPAVEDWITHHREDLADSEQDAG